MYCSAKAGLTVSATALLVKPFWATSALKPVAGAVVSPSRSATVLLYSMWVSRRTGASPGWDSSGEVVPPAPALPEDPTLPPAPGRPDAEDEATTDPTTASGAKHAQARQA